MQRELTEAERHWLLTAAVCGQVGARGEDRRGRDGEMAYKVKGSKSAPKTVKPIVLMVRTRDSQGCPLMLEALHEEQTVDVSNELNREFLIVFGEPELWQPDPAKVGGRA